MYGVRLFCRLKNSIFTEIVPVPFKGTVSIISSDPLCQCSIHNGTLKSYVWISIWIKYQYLMLKLLNFNCGFDTKVTCALQTLQ